LASRNILEEVSYFALLARIVCAFPTILDIDALNTCVVTTNIVIINALFASSAISTNRTIGYKITANFALSEFRVIIGATICAICAIGTA
jgi:hypothetical protein